MVVVAVAHVHRMVLLEVLAEAVVVIHRLHLVVLEHLVKVMLEEAQYVNLVFQDKDKVVLEVVVLLL